MVKALLWFKLCKQSYIIVYMYLCYCLIVSMYFKVKGTMIVRLEDIYSKLLF